MSDPINPTLQTGLFQEVRAVLNSALDALESEQSKVNKALFEALTPQQRDTFCKTLADQNVKPKRIQTITGKSQPTINRHLNGKNS
jgi:hypothetical protein